MVGVSVPVQNTKRPQNQEIREQTAQKRDMAFPIRDQYSIHLSNDGGGLGLVKSLFEPR